MTDITVPVPDDRIAQFYQFFGLWLAGSLDVSSGETEPRLAAGSRGSLAKESSDQRKRKWTGAPDEAADAEELLSKLTNPAREMFNLLGGDEPGRKYTGQEIADATSISSVNAVAATLTWPATYCKRMGRDLPIQWNPHDEAGSVYWMNPEVAALFSRVLAEGP